MKNLALYIFSFLFIFGGVGISLFMRFKYHVWNKYDWTANHKLLIDHWPIWICVTALFLVGGFFLYKAKKDF